MDDMFIHNQAHQQAMDMHNQAHQQAVDAGQRASQEAMDMAQRTEQSMQNITAVGRRNVGLVAIAAAATVALGAAIYASFRKKRELPAIKEAAEGNSQSMSR